ncbi:MAG: hypothetical protein ACRDK8_09225 [Solirubrobacteraceae bacterium]
MGHDCGALPASHGVTPTISSPFLNGPVILSIRSALPSLTYSVLDGLVDHWVS